MKIFHVVGTRPNLMKVSPIWIEIETLTNFNQFLIHTGQHYDLNMSEVIFHDLGLPLPDINFGVGSGSYAHQTSEIMINIERELMEINPDLVLVYGDVNSTIAAALVCSKLLIPILVLIIISLLFSFSQS